MSDQRMRYKARKARDNMYSSIVWMVIEDDAEGERDTGVIIRRDRDGFYVELDRNHYEGLGGAFDRAIELIGG